ncbi:hypothetical protein EZS27_017315 [termite gut metagenome]|uniref:Uncharacterized protein n=1 Tax=termite gut metagenome TaxID=433724 RepID=A0A5J4RML2_9ZZZZ
MFSNNSQTLKALIYVVLQTVTKSCDMASMAPKTLYLLRPEGVGMKILFKHHIQATNAPYTKWTASAK